MEQQPPSFNFSIERNTKGFNYSISVVGARTAEEADTLREAALQQVSKAIAQANRDLHGGTLG